MIKVIGIDPGLSATGIGIIKGHGSKIDGYSFGSISKIFSKLVQILSQEQPDLMVIEDVYSLKKYPKSGIMLGQVTGIVLLAGFQTSVPSIEIPVREAKQILTGNGNANKAQLEKAVRHRLKHKEPIRPSHASDAIGMALIGLYRYQDGRLSNKLSSE
jgi:crossover junction endodeoxyribonuclease RuvC